MPVNPEIATNIANNLPHTDWTGSAMRGLQLQQAQQLAPIQVQQAQANVASTQAQTELNNLKITSAKLSQLTNYLASTTPQNYQQRVAYAVNQGWIKPGDAPQQFDANWINSHIDTVESQKNQADLALKNAQANMYNAYAKFGGKTPAAVITGQQVMSYINKGDFATANAIAASGHIIPQGTILTPTNWKQVLSGDNSQPVNVPNTPQPNVPTSTTYGLTTMPGAKESLGNLEEGKAAGKETLKYNEEITKEAKGAIDMHQTLGELRTALTQFQAGALAPAKVTLQRVARAVGVPVNVSELSNAQIVTKLVNDIIIKDVKAEGQGSRLQAAFQATKAANPNIGMEPESLSTLIDILDSRAAEITNEQQAWSAAKRNNPNISAADFMRDYTANRAQQQEQAGGGLPAYTGAQNLYVAPESIPNGGKVLPNQVLGMPTSKDKLIKGQTYRTPRGIAIWDGTKFNM